MKKCPSCEKTYEDSMRFCQIDGTPLVDDAPPVDPFKTMVARPISTSEPTPEPPTPVALDPISVAPSAFEPAPPANKVMDEEPLAPPAFDPQPSAPIAVEPEPPAPAAVEPEPEVVPAAINEPEEVLDLPAADPLKTMYVSEDEMRKALGAVNDPEEPEMEIPSPEPPKFIENEMPSPPDPTPMVPEFEKTKPPIPSPFGDQSPGVKITAPSTAPDEEPETVMQNFPPASPFSTPPVEPMPEPEPEPQFSAPPAEPAFAEPEPFQPAAASPFQDQSSPMQQDNSPAAWTPPPAPDANWQNQEIGSNTPFQPPPAGGSVNQTLPIVALVLGIISICCYVSPVTGLGALITGWMGLKNIKNDPANYGGRGLALGGMIVGGIFFLIGVAYWVFIVLIYAGILAGSMMPRF